MNTPSVAIVIPYHIRDKKFDMCLAAIKSLNPAPHECIVVHDGPLARKAKPISGITFCETDNKKGPAHSRNYGVNNAQSEIICFIDSDVVVKPNLVQNIKAAFSNYPDISAVFGSYDKTPFASNFLSQYRNLLHHYVHQNSSTEAFTFWSGCGAINKEVFQNIGGFDETKFSKPSIEDIELGYRLKSDGYQIRLEKKIEVTHLKKWEFLNMINTDLFDRAIPWSTLILKSQNLNNDLNINTESRISVVLVFMMIIAMLTSFIHISGIASLILTIFLFIYVNRKFLFFLKDLKGWNFMLRSIPWQILHYGISGLGFSVAFVKHNFLNESRRK